LLEESLAVLVTAHRRAATGRRPDRRDDRADHQIPLSRLVGQTLQIVVRRVDADVRVEQEQVESVELDAVHFSRRGQVEHRVQLDGRLRIGTFADHPGPGGVVQFGKVVRGHGSIPFV
jgi:hypothetical protein